MTDLHTLSEASEKNPLTVFSCLYNVLHLYFRVLGGRVGLCVRQSLGRARLRAMLASFPVKEPKAYAGNFPKITEPKEVAYFSRDRSRKIHFDRRQLQPYRAPTLPAALNEDYERFRTKTADPEGPAPMGDLLAALGHRKIGLKPGQVVTFRNNLNKLFATPYNRKDDWEIGVELAEDGTLRLQVRETARQVAEEANRDDYQKRAAYWGLRFEQLCTLTAAQSKALTAARTRSADGYRVPSPSDPGSYDELYDAASLASLRTQYGGSAGGSSAADGGSSAADAQLAPVDANEEFCSVRELSIGSTKLLMGAEIDCVSDGTTAGLKPGGYSAPPSPTCAEPP